MMKRTWVYDDMITVNRPKQQILQFLADFTKSYHLQPWMSFAQQIPVTGTQVKKFRAIQEVPMLFYFSKSIDLTIDLSVKTQNEIVFTLHPGGVLDMSSRYRFQQGSNKNQTVVIEHTEMVGNILLLPFCFGAMKKAHKIMFKRLKWFMQSKNQ